MTTHTILYHQHCADGSAAALAAWLALGDREARYIPCSYGRPLPDDIEAGSDVYLLDFTAKRGEMLALAQIAGRITVLDHHASAAAELAGLPEQARNTMGACEIRTVFDLARSGCALAWKHFHPDEPMPFLFRLIEDRDLWRFAHPGSRALHYALDLDADFRALADGVRYTPTVHRWVHDGNAVLPYVRRQVARIVATAGPLLRWSDHVARDGAAPTVRMLNCPPQWFSEAGGHLLAVCPDTDIALLYCDSEQTHRRTWSLRSRRDGPDVAAIAAAHGGGGHPNAAGFHTDLDAYALGLAPCYRAAEYSAARAPEAAAA
ncbi:MAG: hypothetical protein EOL91_07230 [Actinobacteria bacterium]|nr:hypothetical protein [Actinomycetota bacterium]